MAENIISYNHNNTLINQRYKDGYINLTAMAQANGKLIADYLRLESTNAFLAELSGSMGIPIDQLIIKKTTGPNSERGTWGHPQIAIHCGQWLNSNKTLNQKTAGIPIDRNPCCLLNHPSSGADGSLRITLMPIHRGVVPVVGCHDLPRQWRLSDQQ